MPASTQVCRALSDGGLAVQDGIDAQTVAENIAVAMQSAKAENIKIDGFDIPFKGEVSQEGEVGRVVCQHLTG